MVTCIHPTERFKDTASTCGVAQLEVIGAKNWARNRDSEGKLEMMNLMRKQMAPTCCVCEKELEAREQDICEPCAKVSNDESNT